MDKSNKFMKNGHDNMDQMNNGNQNAPSPYETPVINNLSSILANTWDNTPSPAHLHQQMTDIEHNIDDDQDDDQEEDDEDQSATNPEPPKELIEGQLLDADNIGETVFSKRWVLSTLLKILKYLEDDDINQLEELDEEFQDDICKLWDMSMNQDVVSFLVEHKSVSLFIKCIEKSNSLRAKEMCIGILGNMMCSKPICQMLSTDEKLVSFLILLLQCDDPPMLIESLRLLTTCISYEELHKSWVTPIKESPHVLNSILFILQSSTNANLLKSTAEFVSKLLEVDDEACVQWSCPDIVLAVLEAFKQTGSHESHMYEELMSILQYISTNERGVEALVTYAGEICILSIGYLRNLCDDVLVVVVGNENIIASTLSVLNVLFVYWDANVDFIIQDYSFVRVLVKLLESVNKLPYIDIKVDNIDDEMTKNDSTDGEHTTHPVFHLIHDLLITLLKDALGLLLKGCTSKEIDVTPLKSVPRSLEYIERSCNENRLKLLFACLNNVDVWINIANKYKCFKFKDFLKKQCHL